MLLRKIILATISIVSLAGLGCAHAGTLENLERERAILLDTLLAEELSISERQAKLSVTQTRLIDLERMVLRDTSLKGKNTPLVRSAFSNYDLTFLMHASIEKDRLLMDHWFEQLGITGQSILNAQAGRR